MNISLRAALRVLNDATENEVIGLAEGNLCIAWYENEYRLMTYSAELEKLLFSGDEGWLDVHVPPDDRHEESLRKYIAAYLTEMYKYIVEDW